MLGAWFIVVPMGFTPGLRPAPSARSVAGRPEQMISDLDGMLMEQVEAHGSILHELKECNKIQSNNIQTLVSCPRLPHLPIPRPLTPPHRVPPTLTKTAALAGRDLQGYGGVQ